MTRDTSPIPTTGTVLTKPPSGGQPPSSVQPAYNPFSFLKSWGRQTQNKGIKVAILLFALGNVAISMITTMLAGYWRIGAGKPDRDEIPSVVLALVFEFLIPNFIIAFMCMNVRGWRLIASRKVYNFQAWIALAIVALITFIVVGSTVYFALFAPLLEFVAIPTGGFAVDYPYHMRVDHNLHLVYTLTAWAMGLAIAWGLLDPNMGSVLEDDSGQRQVLVDLQRTKPR